MCIRTQLYIPILSYNMGIYFMKKQHSLLSNLLSTLLIALIILTPLTEVFAANTINSPQSTSDDDSEDEDEESEEEKDARLAEQTAAEVSDYARAAGIDLSIDAVYGAQPSGSSVTVDGVSLNKEAAMEAIDAMAAAKESGAFGVISTDKTLAAYGSGNICAGCVVGLNTGVTGSPENVAHSEINYTISTKNVVSVRNTTNTTAIPVKDASKAIEKIKTQDISGKTGLITTPSGQEFDMFGNPVTTTKTKKDITEIYREYAEGMIESGNTNLSGTTNTGFTYDPNTGNFVGNQNKQVVSESSVKDADKIKEIAQNNLGSGVSINYGVGTGEGVVSIQNAITGVVTNYDVNTNEVINPNTIWSVSGYDLLFSGTAISGGENIGNNTFVNTSPTQNAMLGMNINGQNVTELSDQFANILAGENANLAGKIGRGEKLTEEELHEAIMIVGIAINRSASTGGNIDTWINDKNIYSSLRNNSNTGLPEYVMRINELSKNSNYDHDKIAELYEKVFSGQMAINTFLPEGTNLDPEAAFATHFYSTNCPGCYTGGGNLPSWINSVIDGSSAEIGLHTFANLNLSDGSKQEYRTKNILEYGNVNVVNVVKQSLGEIGDQINYNKLYAGNLLSDQEMRDAIGPVFTFNNLTKIVETEDIDMSSSPVPPLNVPNNTNSVFLENGNASRNLDIVDELKSQLNYAGQELKLTIHVFSGGQISVAEAKAMGAKRDADGYWRLPDGTKVRYKETTNHDGGLAADINLKDANGKLLDYNNANDRKIIADYITTVVAAGANGIGAGNGYMSSTGIHVGGKDRPMYWGGACACAAGAPDWVKEAHDKGVALRGNFDESKLNNQTGGTSPNNTNTGTGNSFFGDIVNGVRGGISNITNGASDNIKVELPNIGELTSELPDFNNPFVRMMIGLYGMFGSGTGNLNNFNNDSNSSSGGGSNSFSCPAASQLTPEYLSTVSDPVLYQKLLDCLNQSKNQQAGSVIIPFLNNDWFSSIGKLFTRTTDTEISTPEVKTQPISIPVTITVSSVDNSISFSREDIMDILDKNIEHYKSNPDELAEILAILDDNPIIFDEDGTIIFSNGLYSPAVINGVEVEMDQDYEYVYLLQYEDANGNIIQMSENTSLLPENALTGLISAIFINSSPFEINHVKNITYRLVDPNKNIRNDEYYDYVITLVNGSTRGAIVPQYASVEFMRNKFNQIGFEGDILLLIGQAVENKEEPKGTLFRQLVDNAVSTFSGFMNPLNVDTNNDYTNLPSLSGNPTSSDIKSIFIYPVTTIVCPTGTAGYMYTMILNDKSDSNYVYALTDGRCGSGTPNEIVQETARHISEQYFMPDVSATNISSKVSFHTDPVLFNPGLSRIQVGNTSAPTSPEDTETTTPIATSTPTTTPEQLPNLTNEITFEVKAVGSSGNILADWTETQKVTISDSVQLYFRWNATSYQQCLLFLNDNGNYSLTVRNRAMTTGNTETEGYNVTERNGIYRIECGGQRNNEFGVDSKEIEVVVQ